jgi:hypothetical protein
MVFVYYGIECKDLIRERVIVGHSRASDNSQTGGSQLVIERENTHSELSSARDMPGDGRGKKG